MAAAPIAMAATPASSVLLMFMGMLPCRQVDLL